MEEPCKRVRVSSPCNTKDEIQRKTGMTLTAECFERALREMVVTEGCEYTVTFGFIVSRGLILSHYMI